MASTLVLAVVVLAAASATPVEVSRRSSFSDLLAESKLSDNSILAPFQAALASPEAQMFLHQGDSQKHKNIVMYKTHKTAGGTLCSVLFRFASRHHSRILNDSPEITEISKDVFINWSVNHTSQLQDHYNTVMRHVGPKSGPPPLPLPEMIKFFQYIIDKPLIITVLREPLEQSLSYLYFYHGKEISLLGLTKAIEEYLPHNPQGAEFGIDTQEKLNRFLEIEMDLFDMICVTEHFDECMVLLRRRMNWDMVDITYLRVHDADENEILFVINLNQVIMQISSNKRLIIRNNASVA
jgi:hypothetical protein